MAVPNLFAFYLLTEFGSCSLFTFLLPELMLHILCNPIMLPVAFTGSPSPLLSTCACFCPTISPSLSLSLSHPPRSFIAISVRH